MRIVYSAYQKFLEAKGKKTEGNWKIYMFHEVSEEKEKWRDSNCAMTPQSFKNLINSLIERDAKFISLEEGLKGNNLNKTCVSITFDDAYEEVYINAFPYLKEKNIPFTVFMATDFIDKKGYLSSDQIKEMVEGGLCTLGAHSISHRLLRQLNKEESKKEIEGSKSILEEKFHMEIEYFAYPYGSVYACSKTNREQAKASLYKAAFSTLSSNISMENLKDKFFLPRINVNEENYKKL